jgi:hypothetical protein
MNNTPAAQQWEIEQTVLEEFLAARNALMIVVAKLQTASTILASIPFSSTRGPGISAIQTISRVNVRPIQAGLQNRRLLLRQRQHPKHQYAFEHFSNVVVSDSTPQRPPCPSPSLHRPPQIRRLTQFFNTFTAILQDPPAR